MNVLLLKGCFFCLFLVLAALWDLKKREIPDVLAVLILFTGFLDIRPWNAILGFIMTGLPYLFAAVFIKKEDGFSMGGGDIKLMAACGFVLGIFFGTLQSILSLTMALIFGVCLSCYQNNKKVKTMSYDVWQGTKQKERMSLPLAPFFCAGGIFSYMVFYLTTVQNLGGKG